MKNCLVDLRPYILRSDGAFPVFVDDGSYRPNRAFLAKVKGCARGNIPSEVEKDLEARLISQYFLPNDCSPKFLLHWRYSYKFKSIGENQLIVDEKTKYVQCFNRPPRVDHVSTKLTRSNSLWHVRMRGHHAQTGGSGFPIPFYVELLNVTIHDISLDVVEIMMVHYPTILHYWRGYVTSHTQAVLEV
ncbi:uncharacterized protein HKW66_Vig0130040 [Vigna angularis]|uniref:Uncharacterized protein n=1 Tax=Phaseolus angularis TaxID=3914 RepID=A0A8T0K6C3_PHAAN|nr:uncharacterized protein HKW66_Vig0130040 [Vigna angularis]